MPSNYTYPKKIHSIEDFLICHITLGEQAEASRFCQVDPAQCLIMCGLAFAWLAWLGFAQVLLACLAHLPGVCLIFCTFKLQFKSWEYYVWVCDRWRITDTHIYTHIHTQQGITNTLALPIEKMLYNLPLLCPHSEHQKNPFQSKHFKHFHQRNWFT
jgi:hypothetical protein